MREDPTQPRDFFGSEQWKGTEIRIFQGVSGGDYPIRGRSFSGFERNRLFLQRENNFDDLTLVSGADFLDDGRSTSMLDFDNDGYLDLCLSGPLTPKFRLLRNRLGDLSGQPNSFFRIKLIGAKTDAKGKGEWSNRDGIGAKIIVHSGGKKRAFEKTCGEGLAATNSSLIHVGVKAGETVDKVEVRWPSGKTTTDENIKLGETIEIFERRLQ